ncbi:Mth938-like domain-containing protein [Limnohabitans radicicola]|uniref:Mth938-like domain-containing protein n=1 Tax=Limnohabitans radicicola TaxID=2771427 RepID=A0A927FG83_9BURK|nr:Mth938-like domain-containing protein [Limnohabitans radicicola]MBD8050865.1 Mth938-like domain-containing protein [Limnohabitans radicicola]
MKLQPDKSNAPMVRAYGPGWIDIDHDRHVHSVLVSSLADMPTTAWAPPGFEALQAQHLAPLATCGAELVILGTGQRLRFVPSSWLAPFAEHRVGLEAMDTAAACRTYNILASEGRKVVAALLIESDSTNSVR